MPLTPKQKQQLKGLAHSLKPVIIIGNQGFSKGVQNELERALHDHELIKVRIQHTDRQHRRQLAEEICRSHAAELVQIIGNISTLYRKNPNKD